MGIHRPVRQDSLTVDHGELYRDTAAELVIAEWGKRVVKVGLPEEVGAVSS